MPREPELERAILDVLWSADAPLSAEEVRARLAPERVLAYTTVTTVLGRLHRKGELEREKVGRAYRYRPRHDRAEVEARELLGLLESAGGRNSVLARFVGSLDAKDRETLQRLLEGAR